MSSPTQALPSAGQLKELLLLEPRWTVAAAESLTSGRVQALIGSVSGASGYFWGGVTAYSLEQKTAHLEVDAVEASAVNCVSENIAAQMARGVARKFGTTWGLATTGYAEPWPEKDVAAPFAWVGIFGPIAKNLSTYSQRISCDGRARIEVQQYVADEAVRLLVECVRRAREGASR